MMVQIGVMDIARNLSMTQDEGKLAIFKSFNEVEKARSVADKVVKGDLARGMRIPFKISS
jgi:hypothetical protein